MNAPFLWVGVDLFFVLSGYLITGVLMREADLVPFRTVVKFFYTRRAFRILIPYAFLMAAVTLAVESSWLSFWPYYAFFAQNFAVAFFGRQGTLNPLWSLAVEEQFYLTWPIIVCFVPRRYLGRVCYGLIAAALALRAGATYFAPSYMITFTLMPMRMDLLAAGALLALAEYNGKSLLPSRKSAIAAVVGAGAAFIALAAVEPGFRAKTNSLIFNTVGYSLVLSACTATIIIALTGSAGIVHTFLMWPPLRYVGRISFMCYMAHEPILKLMNAHLNPARSVVAFAAVIAFASLTWFAFEARCIEVAKKLTRRPPQPDAAAASVART